MNIGKKSKFFNFRGGGGGNLVLVLMTTDILHRKNLIQIVYIIHIFRQVKYFLTIVPEFKIQQIQNLELS